MEVWLNNKVGKAACWELQLFHYFCNLFTEGKSSILEQLLHSSRLQWPRSLSHGSAAVWFMGFRVWTCQGHWCLYLVSVVCCQVEVYAMGQSLVQRSPTACWCLWSV